MAVFDIFISHSSVDKITADATCAALEAEGIRCWIAPRDITPGTSWAAAIIHALDNARAMVLIFSQHANTSPQIRREVDRAMNKGIPVVPLRIEDIVPTEELEYFMGRVHWLDAWTPPMDQHLKKLAFAVKALLNAGIGPLKPPSASGPEGETLDDESVRTKLAAHAQATGQDRPLGPDATMNRSASTLGFRRAVAGHGTLPVFSRKWLIAASAAVLAVAALATATVLLFPSAPRMKPVTVATAVGARPSIAPKPQIPAARPAAEPAAAAAPRSADCQDVLCDTDWTYTESFKSPPRPLGFVSNHIVVLGAAKGIYTITGNHVHIEVNKKFAEYDANFDAKYMRGYASNANNISWTWSASKK